ncbi:unnamed protein product [Dovyalis caffra]|uniref:RPA-interacting protein n=1 Tax=Dovyalis caffra TaxID=77055 RepID=A0AAV1SFB6_9ROSI|nr:unnamed protein product [Dovyalis caffra]
MANRTEKNSAPTSKRQSLKTQSIFNNYPSWKNKLRENCYKRVREDRTRLLWNMRLPTAKSADNKDFIKSAFKEIVSDELEKIKNSSSNEQLKFPTCALEASDEVLWEYDGLHDAYQCECEEILLEMQRIFYEDLRDETTKKEPENYIETWEDKEDDYLARAVYEQMQLSDKKVAKEIWCPICKQGELQENHQRIYCSLCELQLNKGDEVNLAILQTRLAEAHEEHLDRGCRSKPKFCIETRFGLTALFIVCQDCDTFERTLWNSSKFGAACLHLVFTELYPCVLLGKLLKTLKYYNSDISESYPEYNWDVTNEGLRQVFLDK